MPKPYTKDILNFVAFISLFIPAMAMMNRWTHTEDIIVLASETTPTPQVLKPTSFPEEVSKSGGVVGPEYKEIDAYIKEVFGPDYDKAILLLKGNGKCGGENGKLNPKAVNTAGNTPKGSRDIGIFQINEYWQGVNAKFLFDWKINIQMAHKIYRHSGNTFKMWTAGKCMGI